MTISRRMTRFAAAIALAMGVVTFDGMPGVSTPSASATIQYEAPFQTANFGIGGEHLCFVATSFLHCAGDNAKGQLATGDTTDVPHGKRVEISGNTMTLANVFETTAGLNHSCVLSTTGVVYCWGDNQYGQLGDGTLVDKSIPTMVADNPAGSFVNTGVQKIVAGHHHTCALKAGKIYCWGRNHKGQLGNNDNTNSRLPVQTLGHFDTNSAMGPMTAGEAHTCATSFAADYLPYCWGDNQYGQLGDGSNTDSQIPRLVDQTINTVRNAQFPWEIAATDHSTCLVGSNRSVYCWGRNNSKQLGNNSTTNSNVPVLVLDNGTFANSGSVSRYIAAGGETVCVHTVTSGTGKLHCWGGNAGGQIAGSSNASEGRATEIAAHSAESFDPATVSGNVYIAVSKSTTTGFACLQKWCWGSNSSGQLASNTTTVGAANVMPVKFKTGTNFSSGGGSGGSGPVGGGGNTPTLAALGSVVITEEAGLTAKTTVTGLLAGGRISVFVQEKGWRPAMGATEYPISIRGAVDSSTATLRGVVFGGMSPGAAARVEPFVVGKTYDINVNQFVGSAFSPTVVREFTFTGNVAAAAATTADAETIAPVAKPTVAPAPAVVPGVTVTDAKVYTKSAPKKVATGSAIAVMTPAQAKVNDVVSLTPRICLAAEDDLVFIQTGRCVAQVVNEKTGRVLRALTTRVVADEVSELNVGNEIVTLAPIYFTGGSAAVDANAKKRLKDLTDRISAAGTVLLVGHSGILMGNTPENQQLGRARAIAARNELRSMGAKGPFYFTSAGALAPATTKMTNEAQAKNRRVVIVLIP